MKYPKTGKFKKSLGVEDSHVVRNTFYKFDQICHVLL